MMVLYLLTEGIDSDLLARKNLSYVTKQNNSSWNITDKQGVEYKLMYDVDRKDWCLSCLQVDTNGVQSCKINIVFDVNANKAVIKYAVDFRGKNGTARIFKANRYVAAYAPIVLVLSTLIVVGYFNCCYVQY